MFNANTNKHNYSKLFETLTDYSELFNVLERSAFVPDSIATSDKGSSVITIEVPGCEKEHISVTADTGVLHVTYAPQTKDTYIRPFNKKYQLGSEADLTSISAEVKNGLLKITVPKINRQNRASGVNVAVN